MRGLKPDRLEISWGREWGVYYFICPACNHYMTIVAAVGSPPGCTCSHCGAYDPDMGWNGLEDEPANDGAWLAPIRNPVIDMQWPRVENVRHGAQTKNWPEWIARQKSTMRSMTPGY